MHHQPVKSSNIASVGYDHANKALEVKFTNGGIYQYADVPEKEHAALMSADSVGRHFASNIRNNYKVTKVDTQP